MEEKIGEIESQLKRFKIHENNSKDEIETLRKKIQ